MDTPVATNTVVAPTDPDPDLGRVDEDAPGEWRWSCGHCPARSVETYPTFLAVWDGLKAHHDAVGHR